ncbi:MAG: hypothetical protein IKN78_07235 [Bacteroidales bacterium]|nr:hypothetical protein [Bacteroidales bacterium]
MKNILLTLAIVLAAVVVSAQMTFTVQGPEKKYNQIRIVNETSQTNFKCRVLILNEDGSDSKEVYGVYELKEKGDSDFNTNKILQGTKLKIQKPKGFPVELDFNVEYKNIPLFDIIIIHLFDKGADANAAPSEEFE